MMLAPVLAAFPLALLYMMLVASYWHHYDIGSSGGNGFALLIFYGPGSLAIFLAISIFGWPVLRRFHVGVRLTTFFVLLAMLLALVICVTYEVRRTADYPTNVRTPFGEFLRDFVRNRFNL
jgi:ABC-type dipeptide/oligopeptide/nickel transport system permease subunit